MRFPHMCRMGHPPIGHSESEHEECPLCRAISIADEAIAFADAHYPKKAEELGKRLEELRGEET